MTATDKSARPAEDPPLEISLSSATELCQLGLGTMIDIRQAFEIEAAGDVAAIEHEHQVLGGDIARRLGRERAAAEPAKA